VGRDCDDRRQASRASPRPCPGERSQSRGYAAAVGKEAHQLERGSLRPREAAGRRRARGRSTAKPGASPDGPSRAWTRRAERLTRPPMRPFMFNPGPRLLAGPEQAEALAEKLPPGPCLFVTDQDLVRLGLTDAYRDAIGATREVVVFNSVEADPSRDTLLAATEA